MIGLTNERTRCGANYQELASGIGVVSFSVLLQWALPQAGATNIASLALILLLAFLAIARAAGVGWKDLQEEKRIFQAMFRAEKDRR